MITVIIQINGRPIYKKSAIRQTNRRAPAGKKVYLTDTDREILHAPDDGAIKLATMMLATIDQEKERLG